MLTRGRLKPGLQTKNGFQALPDSEAFEAFDGMGWRNSSGADVAAISERVAAKGAFFAGDQFQTLFALGVAGVGDQAQGAV